jgi:MFS superfamily sulfate permease-like transporter
MLGESIKGLSSKEELVPVRFGFNEWLGALGDLGTFVPIFLSLAALNGLPPARTLVLVGLVYITSALYFRLPMPVQPLKAMAAIAIAGGLGMPLLVAGGIWMGLILLALAASGRIEWMEQYFTPPIVKGIQLGVGLMLIKASFSLMTLGSYPSGLPSQMSINSLPGIAGFLTALWVLVLPQLPLTLGNAVFAVSDVADHHFGKKAKRAAPKNLAVSLGVANLTIGALGAMPVCHGSGGLTAHYRFGARTAGSTIIMGGIYLFLGLVFVHLGGPVLRSIPPWVLGAMLLYVGICHSQLFLYLKEKHLLAFAMGLIALFTSNLAYSLFFGLIVENVPRLAYKMWSRRTMGSKL